MGPLAGLKVVDLTHVMAGPTCTMMLADMGADVIKIEKSPSGDDTRLSVPPKIGDEAASFMMMNRNKRGIVLDLKKPGGAEVLRRLVAQVTRPVRWDSCQETLRGRGVTALVELPPSGTLVGLAKRELRGVPALALKTPDDLDAAVALVEEHGMAGSHAAGSRR